MLSFQEISNKEKIHLKNARYNCRIDFVNATVFYLLGFELWVDVGLNIPKPPDSLQPYQDFGNHQVTGKTLWTWPVR